MARTRSRKATEVVTGREAAGQVRFEDVLVVVWRRRWLASSVLAMCVALAAGYLVMTPAAYDARATLLIEPEVPKSVTFSDATDSGKESYFATQCQILASRRLAARTLDDLDLWRDPEFGAAPPVTPGTPAQGPTAALPTVPARDGVSAARAGAPDRRRPVDVFLSRVTVAPRNASRVVDVTFRAHSPKLAARVVNGLADAYIAQNLDFRASAARDASVWLQRQLEEQRQRVQADELALQQYREDSGLSPQGRENLVAQTLGEVSSAATRARMDRIRKEATYAQLAAIANNQASLESLPDVLANPYLQQLKSELARLQREKAQAAERLGAEHPDMLRLDAGIRNTEDRLQGELTKMVESARNEMLAAQSQERGLQAALRSQRGEALKDSRQSIEVDILRRNLASDQLVLDSLLQRAKEASMSAQLTASNIVVLDRADVPRAPAWPKTNLVLLIGLFVGSCAAVGTAFVLEHLDSRLRSSDDLVETLGVRPLGVVPRFAPSSNGQGPRLLADPAPSFVSEAFRFVRANALFTAETSGIRQFIVTSAAPGDGKTLVACNLAAALSHAGDRVLLVDGDLRMPQVHRTFKVPRVPGFSDFLLGTAEQPAVVRPTGVPNLWVIPAGAAVKRPADLLATPRLGEVLAVLGASYDWLIIDSPPVMTVVDACLIGRAGPAVLFVVGAGQTSERTARAAVEQLRAAGVRVVGTVLNRTELALEARNYARYYHPSRPAGG